MKRQEWLNQAEAAAMELVRGCRAVRDSERTMGAVPPTTSQGRGERADGVCTRARAAAQAQQRLAKSDAIRVEADVQALQQQSEADLQRAVGSLLQLLHGFCPSSDSAWSTSTRSDASRLLQLPQELLSTVVHLAGKDARPACRALRAAFEGPLGSALREPVLQGASVEHVVARHKAANRGFHHDYLWNDELLCLIEPCHPPPRICLETIQHCAHRWPGHVTRLELSGVAATDLAALVAIHQALPGLRALKCGWVAVPAGGAAAVPQFAALTALTLTSHVQDGLLRRFRHAGGASTLPTLRIAPAVQRLRLDFRFQLLTAGTVAALGALQHLAHLDVTFDEAVRTLAEDDVSQWQHARNALQQVGGRLRSLTLRSPAEWIEGADVAVEWMTQLTALRLLAYGDSESGYNPVLHGVLSMPELRELVVSQASDPDNSWSTMKVFDLEGAFEADAEDASNLVSLTLPALLLSSSGQVRAQQLPLRIQQQCPHLTSLQMGSCPDPEDGAPVPPAAAAPLLAFWLIPVCQMASLQRLALLLELHDTRCLAMLSLTPSLSSLWLQFLAPARLRAADVRDGAYALGKLTTLTHLALSLSPRHPAGAARGAVKVPVGRVVRGLLEAVGRLPRLQVLEAHGMVRPLASKRPFRALASLPPPALRRLVLRDCCGDADRTAAAERLLASVQALLRRRMPVSVHIDAQVEAGSSAGWWGPAPWDG